MPSNAAPLVVVGSINMDLVCRTPAMPVPGETILGGQFGTIPGGKGANQAVAAAKLAAGSREVYIVGRVGDDDMGERLLNGLQLHGVNTDFVTITEGTASGVAMILVDKRGENSIVVAPGANAKVTPRDVDEAEELIKSAAVVVMQLEIPFETIKHTIALCKRHGVATILDPAPAPARGLPKAMWEVDIFSPNQSEAEILLGLNHPARAKRKGPVDPKAIAMDLLTKGPGTVVLKLGAKGSLRVDQGGTIISAKPFKVKVVDTTAAGDAFTAGLAVSYADEVAPGEALRFANAAGAIACSGFGAQPALPTRAAVEKLVRDR